MIGVVPCLQQQQQYGGQMDRFSQRLMEAGLSPNMHAGLGASGFIITGSFLIATSTCPCTAPDLPSSTSIHRPPLRAPIYPVQAPQDDRQAPTASGRPPTSVSAIGFSLSHHAVECSQAAPSITGAGFADVTCCPALGQLCGCCARAACHPCSSHHLLASSQSQDCLQLPRYQVCSFLRNCCCSACRHQPSYSRNDHN